MKETNTENRKNNFIVIYDFLSEELSNEYKASFKKLYPKGVTHGKWAEDAVGEFTLYESCLFHLKYKYVFRIF